MKVSIVKYHQLNASIRTIRDFCNEVGSACVDCPFWKEDGFGLQNCIFNDRFPEYWKELPKEVLSDD